MTTTLRPCTDAWRRRVSAYQDGGIVGEERQAVEAHLQTCAACQALVADYDQLFRDLRSLPSFEGLLTITRPGSRRGLGANSRPMLTWPGKSLPEPKGPAARRPTGGTIIITMLLLLGLALLFGHGLNEIGPSTAVNPTNHTQSTPMPVPTLNAVTPQGLPCANAGATAPMPYTYLDAHATLWRVASCADPVKQLTLPFSDSSVGTWSPNNTQIVFIMPALTHRTVGTRTHLFVASPYGQTISEVKYAATNATADMDAQAAIWLDDETLIIRTQTKVLEFKLSTHILANLGFSATQIEVRANLLFYSTVAQGQTTLHRYDPATKQDTMLLALGAGQDLCVTSHCWGSAPWDVSLDGLSVAYQYPPTQNLPSVPVAAQLVLQNLRTGTRTMLGSMPLSSATQAISISPDGHYVATMGTDPTQTSIPLTVVSSDGKTQHTFALQGTCAWRPDDQALVITPTTPTETAKAVLVNILTNKQTPLAAQIADYLWQN